MGFLDKAKDKLTDLIDDKGEQLGDGLDKAADFVDDKTGGKFSDKIESGVDKVKDSLDGLDGKQDDIPESDGPQTKAEPAEKAPTRAPRTDDSAATSERPTAKPVPSNRS